MQTEDVLLAILEMVPESSGSHLLVLHNGDDVEQDIPQAGKYGLLTHLDDCWQEPFAWVRIVTVKGSRLFVAELAKSYCPGKYIVVVPDADWVDERLRLVLRVEAEDSANGV